MDDAKLRQLMQENLEMEAQQIMDEVNSAPSLADVEVPQEVHDKLFKQIREYEEQKAKSHLSEEDRELIRLGKVYKRNRKRNRYLVLAAAVIAVLAIGITSFGGPVKVYETVKYLVSGREQTNISSDDERVKSVEVSNEEEAYQLIEETFDCITTRPLYLPEGMEFSEVVIEESIQNARIYYETSDEKVIAYRMLFNYRSSSVGWDVEDEIVQEYTMDVRGHNVHIQQCAVENGDNLRWRAKFQHEKVQCFLGIDGFTQDEVEKIVKNLYFFE